MLAKTEDRASALADMISAGAPDAVPLEVTQVPKPPPPPKQPAPHHQVDIERVFDPAGEISGLNVFPKPGNAVVRVELRDLQDGRWKVGVFTETRRGARPRSMKRKDKQ